MEIRWLAFTQPLGNLWVHLGLASRKTGKIGYAKTRTMTWYANNLYLPATDRVVSVLKSDPRIRPFLYVVKDIAQFPWHTPEVKHSVGPHGLAVVRPLAARDGGRAEWYDEPVLDWSSLFPRTPAASPNPVPANEEEPPPSFLEFLAELTLLTNAPAVYYLACTWGGTLEEEKSWVHNTRLIKYEYVAHPESPTPEVRCLADGNEIIEQGDALQEGLKHLGVELPTHYFALHTRDFPWEKYRETVLLP